MRLHRRMLVLPIAALLLTGCEVGDPDATQVISYPQADLVKTLDDVPYGPEDQQVLDVYSPATPNGGAILWIHGGGWADANGDPASLASEEQMGMQPVVKALARKGWTVFSVRYSGTDEAPFPQNILDVKRALRWVKSRAADFGVSPSAIVAMGWSSGGHLAALLGVSSGSLEPTDLPADLAAVDSRPAAVVTISGVLDPATFPNVPGLPPGNNAGVAALIGCPETPEQWATCNPDLLEATRPTHYDDASDPPMYLVEGSFDGIVDLEDQALTPYAHFVSTMGDDDVWLDIVDTGDPAVYGGDPRSHTLATSYQINANALSFFLDRVRPATAPKPALSTFVSLAPCRLGDTRTGTPFTKLATNAYRVQAAGRCRIPANATSVAATVTVVRPSATGSLAAGPAGTTVSMSIGFYAAGEVRSASAVIGLSSKGQFDLKGAAGGVIVDVTGAWVPAITATAGRYVGVTPAVAFDSVSSLPAGSTTIDLTAAGIPADATAAVVTLTVSATAGSGNVAVARDGDPVPAASVLTTDKPGQTRSATVYVPLHDGRFTLNRTVRSAVRVDVEGWFTGASAERSQAGLYRAVTPRRALDSRGSGLEAGVPVEVSVAPVRAAAVVATTVLFGSGDVTVGEGEGHPEVSGSAGVGTLASFNQPVFPVESGTASLVSSSGADVLVDVYGWFNSDDSA